MRWRLTPSPKEGNRRKRVKFAWFPVLVEGNGVIWLESYIEVQLYSEGWKWRTINRVPIKPL